MMTIELLHDGGFIEELNPLSHAGRLINSLNGNTRLWFVFDHTFGYAFVHHAE